MNTGMLCQTSNEKAKAFISHDAVAAVAVDDVVRVIALWCCYSNAY